VADQAAFSGGCIQLWLMISSGFSSSGGEGLPLSSLREDAELGIAPEGDQELSRQRDNPDLPHSRAS
jgi:hypothetical protein